MRPKRALFWVDSSGYPDADAFLPTGSESNFELSPVLEGLADLKQDMVIVDGVNLRDS
jgi:hypothetical protein